MFQFSRNTSDITVIIYIKPCLIPCLNFIEISGRSTTDHFSGSKSICGWHSGAVVNTDKTLQDGPELGAFCSSHIWTGPLRIFRLPPTFQRHALGLVNLMVYVSMGYPMTELKSAQGVPCFSYFDSWDRLQPLMTLNWISIGKKYG